MNLLLQVLRSGELPTPARALAGVAILLIFLPGVHGCSNETLVQSPSLPYDRSNPVFYDNDWTNDYVDWYLLALASAGDIRYVGISTSSSIAPYNRYMTASALAVEQQRRAEIVARGRASGLRNLPDPVAGSRGHLVRPSSGILRDTAILDSPGSRAIVSAARDAETDKPLLVIVGGPLTTVANAWLMDPGIADRIIVAWIDNHARGMTGFNGWSDGWAAYIVLQHLRLVQFTGDSMPYARVTKERLMTLPDSPAREYMLALKPDVLDPEGDVDGPPAIPLMRPDYAVSAKRVSFGGWERRHGHSMPLFRDDPAGSALVVTAVDREVATQEWWRALENPGAWHPLLQ